MREAVAMSGGVDSSVAALLRVRDGAEVVGLTMQLWDSDCSDAGTRACCGLEHALDARAVCRALGASHKWIDLRDEFRREVVEVFVREYLAGRTPNPCVRCNTHLKWDALWQAARELDCASLSTGHYAKIDAGPEGPELRRGQDLSKDQAYFLWGIPLYLLTHTRFPLGALPKSEVRRLAEEAALPTARKRESQDICFVPGGDYRELVRREAGADRPSLLDPGPIVDADGARLGTHQGLACYTVGQRRGIGVAGAAPLYVVELRPESNELVLGPPRLLERRWLELEQENWLVDPASLSGRELSVQVRFRSQPLPCHLHLSPRGTGLELPRPALAPAPGQSMVVFDGDRVLGGGVLASAT